MRNAELAFQAPDIHLQVRTFSIEEAFSQPFEVFVTARTESSDLDLDAIVGHPAAFRLAIPESVPLGEAPARVWSGVCSHIELVQIEPDGLSTYWLRIVPMLWRTTQRRNHRVFQHVTAAEIATGLLAEWGIEPLLRIDPAGLARHEYRVQYGETDFAFLCRMLEEAGISYRLDLAPPKRQSDKDQSELPTMQLVLMDQPADAARRLPIALPFVGDTADRPATPFVRQVRVSHQVRPGRFTVRDYDFRSSPDLELLASARVRMALEERYEMYHYQPGAFLREAAAARGAVADARVDEQFAQQLVGARLDANRTGRRMVRFQTNVLELVPGLVFSVSGHPRVELNAEHGLICTRMSIEGDVEQETAISAEAAFVTDPLRPALRTPKPRINGVQSAIVVGPKGEDIYTDRYGRVRVQFHWDRVGKHDEHSSCWVRVSQAWAGAGYGIQSVPRVGQEVLVDFFEGDPDQPVVTGRVHNSACNTPYPLPDHKTKTVWKSSTSPGAAGSNEITFEDARGEELVYVHAQRNLERRVEVDEAATVGANLRTLVGANEEREVKGDQSIAVVGDRKVEVSGNHSMRASGLQAQAGESTGMFCQDGKLVLTNGTTSLVLDGPNLYLDAGASVQISAGRSLSLSGQQVRIDGTPNVYINCGQALPPSSESLQLGPLANRLIDGGANLATDQIKLLFDKGKMELPDALTERLQLSEMPAELELPPELNEQIQKLAESVEDSGEIKSKLLDGHLYEQIKQRIQQRIDKEEARLKKLRDDAHAIFSEQRDHVDTLAGQLKGRLKEEWGTLERNWSESRAILGSDAKFIDKCKSLKKVFQAQAKRISVLRKDLTDMFNREKRKFDGYVKQWKDYTQQVRTTIDYFKKLVNDPKDAILDLVLGEEQAAELRETVEKAKETYETAKETLEKVKEWMGYSGDAASGIPPTTPDIPVVPNAPAASGLSPAQSPGLGHQLSPPGGAQASGPSLGKPGGQSIAGDGSLGSAQSISKQPLGPGDGSMGSAQSVGKAPLGQSTGTGSMGQTNGPLAAQREPVKMGSGADRTVGSHATRPGAQASQVGGAGGLGAGSGAGHAMSATPGGQSSLGAKPGMGVGSVGGQSVNPGFHQASGELAGGVAGGAHSGLGTAPLPGSGSSGLGGTPLGQSGGGEVGNAFARSGGLAPSDVATTVTPEGMSVLQTPQDGQMMVVASQSAQPLQPSELTSAAVDAQMAGRPASAGMSDALAQKGYAVYERPWGDFFGKFVRVAQTQAG